jgi:hypothetical protein
MADMQLAPNSHVAGAALMSALFHFMAPWILDDCVCLCGASLRLVYLRSLFLTTAQRPSMLLWLPCTWFAR